MFAKGPLRRASCGAQMRFYESPLNFEERPLGDSVELLRSNI
jgi:hypothetical protein